MSRRGYLYRVFGADGVLLYVGCTMVPGQRFSQHQSQTEWWDEVKRIDVEQFVSRDLAQLAEGVAIRAEEPRYNVIAPGRPVSDEELERRRVARLRTKEEQERRDAAEAASSYHTDLKIICDNCGHKPIRLPKRVLLNDQDCENCECRTLRRIGGPGAVAAERRADMLHDLDRGNSTIEDEAA